ncbi:MAG: hypothetical protein ACRDFY_00685 [Candidatus Limnocylindria bacterium]
MATPKPGEIRCPTCHRSTPPATFCTQCGSAIPSDARIRPRGMDRDELQDRIRQRRSGGDPYRRGANPDDVYTGYQRFEPEPGDAQARRTRRAEERRQDVFTDREAGPPPIPVPPSAPDPASRSIVPPLEPRPDVTREADDSTSRPADAVASPPPLAPPPSDVPVDDGGYVDNFDDEAYADEEGYPYTYDDWDDGRRRGSTGAGAFAILGFLALGVLALLGGAVLAGVFSDDPNTGANDPTLTPSPSLTESLEPTAQESVAPSADPSADPSGSPTESGEPVVFPDGFTAAAQPCLPGSVALDGCDSNGAVNSGAVDMWVGFRSGNGNDVLGVTLIGPDGATIGEGSIELADIRCGQTCNGYTRFPFSGLGPGTYEVQVTRNGELAAETSFEVT